MNNITKICIRIIKTKFPNFDDLKQLEEYLLKTCIILEDDVEIAIQAKEEISKMSEEQKKEARDFLKLVNKIHQENLKNFIWI
jgi:hypothetical protein